MSNVTVNLTEVRTKWAAAMNAEYVSKGINNAVIVLPAFDEEGNAMDTAVTTTGNKGWGYVMLFQAASNHDWKSGAIYDQNRWAIIRANAVSLEAKFKVGANIGGNILTVDTLIPTNMANPAQDLRYTRRDIYDMVAQGNTSAVPCKIADKPIYRVRRWEPTGKEQDIVLEHTNQAEIDLWYNGAVKSLNTPNSNAIKNAGKAALNGVGA